MVPENGFALVIEDDPQIRVLLASILGKDDFEVSAVSNCGDARQVIKGRRPDLVLLDLRLPGGDGMELGKWIKATSPSTGIIILTGRSAQRDRVEGLTVCADDYLTKPFDVEELRIRVRNLMQRLESSRQPAMETVADLVFEGWILREDACALVLNDQMIRLTVMEFRLLGALIRRKGRVANRAWLLDEIGAEFDINERTVDYHVCTLRIKLRKAGLPHEAITAVRGLGYKIAVTPASLPPPLALASPVSLALAPGAAAQGPVDAAGSLRGQAEQWRGRRASFENAPVPNNSLTLLP